MHCYRIIMCEYWIVGSTLEFCQTISSSTKLSRRNFPPDFPKHKFTLCPVFFFFSADVPTSLPIIRQPCKDWITDTSGNLFRESEKLDPRNKGIDGYKSQAVCNRTIHDICIRFFPLERGRERRRYIRSRAFCQFFFHHKPTSVFDWGLSTYMS